MQNKANNLTLEKQFIHHSFCAAVDKIDDIEDLKEQVKILHELFLRQQEVTTLMLKEETKIIKHFLE